MRGMIELCYMCTLRGKGGKTGMHAVLMYGMDGKGVVTCFSTSCMASKGFLRDSPFSMPAS